MKKTKPELTISKLACACFVYRCFSEYDATYDKFLKSVKPGLDLSKSEHRAALLKWLNEWGCRHLAQAAHSKLSSALLAWHAESAPKFPVKSELLSELPPDKLEVMSLLYASLSGVKTKYKTKNVKMRNVSIGPTAAAKILFALRPNVFVPWDGPIRTGLDMGKSGKAYLEFLMHVQSVIVGLDKPCEALGLKIDELPTKLKGAEATLPKLIDEFYWVTITKGAELPDAATLSEWAAWAIAGN